MNRKQLTLLVVLGVVLGGLGWLAWKKQQQPYADSSAKMGNKVLPGLPVNDIEQLTITQAKGALTLAKQDGTWVVRSRGDYPANFDTLRDLLLKFADLKVAKPVVVGPSRLPALELVPPDKGNGTLVEFKDKSGKVLQSVLLGAKSMRESGGDSPFGGGGFPNGRYLMVGTDIGTTALVTEPFAQVEPKAEDWLNKEWFKVERLKSVGVVTTNATNNWKLVRENETGSWKLVDAKAGEELDASKSGSSTSALSYPSFNDVSTNAAAAGLDKPMVTATLETFDGFTYTVKIGSKSGEENHHFQMAVAGNFPRTRAPGKDEKPEDKDRLDKEFAETLKKNEERLKNEKAYEKWVYVVSKWTVDPLLKDRKDLLPDKKEEAKPGEGAAGAPPVPGPLPTQP
ncbi:MAG: hypothetical protein RJA22_3027 [Verrucomicrobiota bacterium]|jgi:hypothetical protein